jgi:hypothetical protein
MGELSSGRRASISGNGVWNKTILSNIPKIMVEMH